MCLGRGVCVLCCAWCAHARSPCLSPGVSCGGRLVALMQATMQTSHSWVAGRVGLADHMLEGKLVKYLPGLYAIKLTHVTGDEEEMDGGHRMRPSRHDDDEPDEDDDQFIAPEGEGREEDEEKEEEEDEDGSFHSGDSLGKGEDDEEGGAHDDDDDEEEAGSDSDD